MEALSNAIMHTILAVFCIGVGMAFGYFYWYLMDTLLMVNKKLKKEENKWLYMKSNL